MVKLQLLRHSKEARLQTSPAAMGAFGVYNLLKYLSCVYIV